MNDCIVIDSCFIQMKNKGCMSKIHGKDLKMLKLKGLLMMGLTRPQF